jgi:molybdopterin-guanine dinucleotide biosynthesis protein A
MPTPADSSPSAGGIVLCGGRSSRMGRPKLSLPFGDELLLQRVVRILRQVVEPVVVVAAPDQEVPELPPQVIVVRDAEEGLGPLAGIAAGLEALQSLVPVAYVSACDVPLLAPSFVRSVLQRLGTHDIAVPREDRFHHPLAAAYRTSLAARTRELLQQGQRRPLHLIEACDTVEIPVAELRAVDPELASLENLNTPEAYERALRRVSESNSR